MFTAKTEHKRLLIIQCAKGHEHTDLIACARYRVMDERKSDKRQGDTHVVFIVQLPRFSGGTSFAAFQGGQWISAHIDDLHVSEGINTVLQVAFNNPLHLFFKSLIEDPNSPPEFNPCLHIRDVIHLAVAGLVFSDQTTVRMERVTDAILSLVPVRNPGYLELGKC